MVSYLNVRLMRVRNSGIKFQIHHRDIILCRTKRIDMHNSILHTFYVNNAYHKMVLDNSWTKSILQLPYKLVFTIYIFE